MTQPSLRRMSVPDQRRRTAELDEIRLQRPLTTSEQAEADRLADAHYLRVWRASQAAQEAALRQRAARPQQQGY